MIISILNEQKEKVQNNSFFSKLIYLEYKLNDNKFKHTVYSCNKIILKGF
jgi:hypothetical protein